MLRLHQTVGEIIAQRRAHAKARGVKFKLGRTPRPIHPYNAERDYLRSMRPMVAALAAIFKQLKPRLSQAMAAANEQRPSNDSARVDGFGEDIRRIMADGKNLWYSMFSHGVIKIKAEKAAKDVDKYNASQFDKAVKQVIGIDVFKGEPWLKQEMDGFVADNVDLIKTIPEAYFDSVQKIVTNGARSGRSMPDIEDDLKVRTGVAASRAAFIARDQIAKFNGDLNRLRQTNVGVSKYIWRTSLDERVRGNPDGLYPDAEPSHWDLEGQIFDWNDPPEPGHPGEDYNCVPEFALTSLHAPTVKAFGRWYDGELTEIVTQSSEPLRVTPNHPVLTLRGWMPAHLLEIGDYLVKATFQDSDFTIENPQGRNSKAGEVFGALKKFGISHRVPGIASWFHGDSTGEDIDIIKINRSLLLAIDSKTLNRRKHDILSSSSKTTLAKSHFSSSDIRLNRASHGSIGGSAKGSATFFGSVLHSQKHCVASPSNGNLALNQDPSYWSPANIQLSSDSDLAHAVLVEPDNFVFVKVKAIVRRSWKGIVHNFETITGWFSSSSLIIHNCRCIAEPVFDEGAENSETPEEPIEDPSAES